ncbi:MAG: hypothetical protein HGA54_06545, partial [Actinobacteria bacterium]|nr:hypothetical protein [Actinomycetota bacterium]
GVLPRNSKACIWLKPIRAELSIIAWILSLGHMAVYLESYIPKIFSGASINGNVLTAFVLALVLFVLLILLGVTSFNFVKKHMKGTTWKKVQKLSYPFFILVYLHVLFMLLPSALHGGIAAVISVTVYSVIFIGYIILRLVRRSLDMREGEIDENSSVALG